MLTRRDMKCCHPHFSSSRLTVFSSYNSRQSRHCLPAIFPTPQLTAGMKTAESNTQHSVTRKRLSSTVSPCQASSTTTMKTTTPSHPISLSLALLEFPELATAQFRHPPLPVSMVRLGEATPDRLWIDWNRLCPHPAGRTGSHLGWRTMIRCGG